MIIWITGLSGAGKSTIAKRVVELLKTQACHPVLLDGDEVRWIIQDPAIGYDRESRLVNAHRISRMAKTLETQGFCVVVATMSLFHEIHDWNRKEFKEYLEVWVQTRQSILQIRDSKQLYSRHAVGQEKGLCGFDQDVEFPTQPDLILENNGENKTEDECDHLQAQEQQIEALARQIISRLSALNPDIISAF